MVRTSVFGAVDFGVIPSQVKPVTLKLVFTASLLKRQCEAPASSTLSIKETM